MDTDGKFNEVSSWTSGSNATGVAVITDTVRLIVAPDEWYTYDGDNDGAWNGNKRSAWGGYNRTVTGIKTTDSSSEAITDFAGSSNTDQIISQLKGTTDSYSSHYTGAPAAEYCQAYSKGCKGVGEWYLPSVGEMNVLVTNKSTINTALSKISGETLGSVPFTWTSTQYSSRTAWGYYWSNEDFDGYSYKASVGFGLFALSKNWYNQFFFKGGANVPPIFFLIFK